MRPTFRFIPIIAFLAVFIACPACSPESPSTDTAATIAPVSPEEAQRWADETLRGLTLERKIGQMICEQMRGEYRPDDDPQFVRWLSLVKDYGLGGFVLYGGTPHDTARLLNRLQKEASVPLLISSDFEGGPGQQFKGASEFPGNMALSAIDSEDLAYQVGRAGAREGRAIGVHLTYSPVVDVLTRPDNPVLGVRSFGADIDRLGRLAGAYIKGYQENGMLATAKHYPGRGDVDLIPGTEFTINNKPSEKIEAEDFAAFRKTFEAGVAFVMSEHIAIPSLAGGSDLPASVEKALAKDWLRDKLGFQGILTTDDMWYKKVTDRFGPVKACVMAVQAGHDAVLKPADVVATIEGLVAAVRKGEIPEAQIDASVRKILSAKARLGLHRNRFVDETRVAAVVGNREHTDLVQKVGDLSLTLLVNKGVFPMDAAKLGKVVHLIIQRRDADPVPALVAAKITEGFPEASTVILRPTSSDGHYDTALARAKAADTVLFSIFNPRTVYVDNGPLRKKDLEFVRAVAASKPKSTVILSYGNPFLAEGLKDAPSFLVGYGEGGFYGNAVVYADSLVKMIKGTLTPKGKLPISVSKDFPAGSGLTY
jgi:beta-N-acetylhexosaminidase